MEYYSATKWKEILPFAKTWTDLEGIMLREINQTEKDKYCMISLMWNLKNKQKNKNKNKLMGASLVVRWLRIRLPMQGTQVQALVRENPTCRGATKPMCRNY